VYVSGSDGGSGTGQDYATIKYTPAATSVEPQPQEPRSALALQSDPNPFTLAMRIRFTIPGTDRDHVRLAMYDVRGEEVALLVNEVLAPGTYERNLNGSTLATGVYWSRLQVGALSETRKIIHVK
jgi:hypothetical protein